MMFCGILLLFVGGFTTTYSIRHIYTDFKTSDVQNKVMLIGGVVMGIYAMTRGVYCVQDLL